MTLMGSPVSLANCSRISRVGLGVWLNTFRNTSNCLALMVVRGPRRLDSLSPFLSESESGSSLSGLLTSLRSGSIPESPELLKDSKLLLLSVVFIWHMKL